jgi:two-component system nitrate/nitrite response regulator NarL
MLQGKRNRLTPRERQVALLAARGLSNKAIALQIGISQGTVKLHLHTAYQKLQINGRRALKTKTTEL